MGQSSLFVALPKTSLFVVANYWGAIVISCELCFCLTMYSSRFYRRLRFQDLENHTSRIDRAAKKEKRKTKA